MVKLSEEAVATIEKHLNASGKRDLLITVQNGRIVVVKLDKKRIV